jgi:predicted CoA-binding protein
MSVMTSAQSIHDFMAERSLAIFGVSRSGGKFGNTILKELSQKGYTLYPIHPHAESIDRVICYPDLESLPGKVGGAIVVVKPDQTEQVVKDAHRAGIRRVWMQQGAESQAALDYCRQNGIDVVSRECILMFTEPVESIHKVHRFLRRVFGRMPA